MNYESIEEYTEIEEYCKKYSNQRWFQEEVEYFINYYQLNSDSVGYNFIWIMKKYSNTMNFNDASYWTLLECCEDLESVNLFVQNIKKEYVDVFELCQKIPIDSILLFEYYLRQYNWTINPNAIDSNGSTLLMHSLQNNKKKISIYLMDFHKCDFNAPPNKFGKDAGYYFIEKLARMIDYKSEFYGEYTYPMVWFNLTIPIYDYLKKNHKDLNKKYTEFMRNKTIVMTINEVYEKLNQFRLETIALKII